MISIWPLHPNFEEDEKIDLVRAINVIYSQEFISKAIIIQNMVYDIFDKSIDELKEDDEDGFQFEVIDKYQKTSSFLSNQEIVQKKPNDKEINNVLSSMRFAKSAHISQPAKLASRLTGNQDDTTSTIATPNMDTSSVNSSNKGTSLRSRLNPNSTVYNADRARFVPNRSVKTSNSSLGEPNYPVITKSMLNSQPQNWTMATDIPYVQRTSGNNEAVNKYHLGNISKPFVLNPSSEAKSKSHIVQLTDKFQSETKISPPKSFTFFGENEIEEELGLHQESDSEDDSKRLAK